MSGPDWCRWYPNRWITGTIQLTLEQRGFFVQVISVIMDLGECSADDAYLARLCNCQERKARRLKSELITLGKLYENDGKLFNERAFVERSLAIRLSTNGRNRAAKRWNNNHISDASVQCKPQPHSEKKERKEPCTGSEFVFPTPESHTSNVTSAKPKRRLTYPEEFQKFWAAYPQRDTDTKKLAFASWQKAIKGGVDPPTLQRGAERYAEYIRKTGHESMLVQTWVNREGWTASYAGSNGHTRPSVEEPWGLYS